MFYLMLIIGVFVMALMAAITSRFRIQNFWALLVLDFVVTFAVLFAVGESSFTHAPSHHVGWASFGIALALAVLLAVVRALDRRGFAPRIFTSPRTPTGQS